MPVISNHHGTSRRCNTGTGGTIGDTDGSGAAAVGGFLELLSLLLILHAYHHSVAQQLTVHAHEGALKAPAS